MTTSSDWWLIKMRVAFLIFVSLCAAASASANSCFTTFPTTQNPISSQGTCTWISGGAVGLDWGDVSVVGGAPGQAHGTVISGGPPFNDSTAVLTGTWATNQYAWAQVAVNANDASGQQEVELRTHTTITAHSITGYEFDYNVKNGSAYVIIVRWNGPLNSFTYCNNAGSCNASSPATVAIPVANNAIIEATTIGTVHTLFVNGVQEFQTTDATYTSGSPGMGFWQQGGTTANLTDFGLKSFFAVDNAYLAASNSEANVNAVINGPTHTAVNGDTILVPCNTASVTWASTLSFTKSIAILGMGGSLNSLPSVFGAGTPCITIHDTVAGWLISAAPTFATTNNVTRFSDFDIEPGSTSNTSPIVINGTGTSGGMPLFRIDNISFGLTTPWTEGGCGAVSGLCDWLIMADNAFGVIDHDTAPNGTGTDLLSAGLDAYLGVGAFGDNSWATPDNYGSQNAIYLENNSAYTNQEITDCEKSPAATAFSGAPGGCRIVDRFNHVFGESGFFVAFGLHGLDTGGRARGGRTQEVYNNTIQCVTTGGCSGGAVAYRAGTGPTFNNSLTQVAGAFFNVVGTATTYRIVYSPPPWGGCGGLSSLDPFDTIDNVVYFTGTITSTTGSNPTVTMTDSTKSFPSLTPSGAPYSVYDVTQGIGFVAEVASNTATSITVQQPISESGWCDLNLTTGICQGGFVTGDSYEIIRATVCMDQGGRGAGLLIQNSTPVLQSTGAVGPVNQALDPMILWNNTASSLNIAYFGPNTSRSIVNRDYYVDTNNRTPTAQTSATAPFNGSTTCNAGAGAYTCGVGFGTLVRRPTTCTTGVFYDAQDAGTWNLSGLGTNDVIYRCISTNVWSVYYVPFTYPHPLISGVVANPNPSLSPGALTFGTVMRLTPSAGQTTTLANNSGSTITITGTTFTGTNGSDFAASANTCTGTIASGSSCAVTVVFTPTATAGTAEIGTLNVAFTGASGSPAQAALSGTSGGSGSQTGSCTETQTTTPNVSVHATHVAKPNESLSTHDAVSGQRPGASTVCVTPH